MNKLFYRMKFKYQRFAIQNLSVYASVGFAIGYLLLSSSVGARFYQNYLMFFPKEVLHGQVWRIITAFLYPPVTGNLFNGILGILIYYSFANAVERMMGSFEFNVYFFGSFLIGEIANILHFLITGINAPFIPMFTHFSVFMAFAIMYAESQILLFFIVPLKAKYLAFFEIAMYLFYFVVGDTYSRYFGITYTRMAIIAAFIPVYLFYRMVYNGSGGIFQSLKNTYHQKKRQKEWRDQWR